MHFVHESLPQRVRFATGGAPDAVRAEVDRLDARRVMVMAGPAAAALAEKVTSELSPVLRHDEVVMHVPVEVAHAHCIDSLWAPSADPINAVFAAEGARALHQGLPLVATAPQGLPGLEMALYGAYLAATAFASAGSGLHHKICHVLGGRFDLPHAQTHATVLPYVLAFNAPNAPDAAERLATAFGSPTALAGLQELRRTLHAPRSLRDLGLREADIQVAVTDVLAIAPPSNPTRVTEQNLTGLLLAAWAGADPTDQAPVIDRPAAG